MRHLTRRQRIAAAVLCAVALMFITLDLGGGSLRSAHSGVRGALGSLYRATDSVLGPLRDFVRGVPSAASNRQTIDDLHKQLAQVRGQVADLQAQQRDAATLKRLQLTADSTQMSVVPGRVTAIGSADGFDWTVTLDVGTGSGIKAGQTVTDGYGVVGRVLHADAASSVVLLAADPGSGIGARDTRTNQIGVVSGDGTDGFTFTPLDPNAVIKPGDSLVTGPSGSSSYVIGIPIGDVVSVRASADGSVRAGVAPAASPTGLDLVGVLVPSGAPIAARPPIAPSGTR